MRTETWHPMPPSDCPYCGAAFGKMQCCGPDASEPLTAGDLALCNRCGQILTLARDLVPRPASVVEVGRFAERAPDEHRAMIEAHKQIRAAFVAALIELALLGPPSAPPPVVVH